MHIWELTLIAAVISLLFGSRQFSELFSGLKRGIKEFQKASKEVSEEFVKAMGFEPTSKNERTPFTLTLWLAEGFGVGRIPFAPGTFGSIVGLVWFWVLLLPKSPIFFLVGVVASIFASVWLCNAGEKILNQRDPGSIVIDEIIAIPICFGSWLAILFFHKGFWPEADYFFSKQNWLMTLGVFVLFRVFDVWKPWPVRQSQNLPGGWGVTIDDVLAAVYVNLVVLLILVFKN